MVVTASSVHAELSHLKSTHQSPDSISLVLESGTQVTDNSEEFQDTFARIVSLPISFIPAPDKFESEESFFLNCFVFVSKSKATLLNYLHFRSNLPS
jgi:hypothetical protein